MPHPSGPPVAALQPGARRHAARKESPAMATATAIEPAARVRNGVPKAHAQTTTTLFRADQKRLNALLGDYENARPGPEQWRLEEQICAELKAYPPSPR
jgi:hypothetical protein